MTEKGIMTLYVAIHVVLRVEPFSGEGTFSTRGVNDRLDFRRSRSTFLPEKRSGRSAGFFPEQRLLIEPNLMNEH